MATAAQKVALFVTGTLFMSLPHDSCRVVGFVLAIMDVAVSWIVV